MNPKFDLTGRRFGKLVAIEVAGSKNSFRQWKCKCDCGNETLVASANLTRGNSASCGKCVRIKHGMARTKIYGIWIAMRDRCGNPNNDAFANYGGRGIGVDPRWESFEAFYEDMGEPPYGGTIERINNELGYSRANCRWATRKEQNNNKRSNDMLTAFGRTQSLTAWADEIGMHPRTLHNRIYRGGMSIEDAIRLPLTR